MIYKNSIHPYQTRQEITSVFAEKAGQYAFSITELLFKKFRYQRKVQIPYSYISKAIGCQPKTVQRTIEWLEERNIIRVLRDIYGVNIYYLTEYYRSPEVFLKCLQYLTKTTVFLLSMLYSKPVLEPNVLLIINNGSYLKSGVLRESYPNACARVRNVPKKKERMNAVEWGNAIKALHTKFPLTERGIMKLSAFPAEAIMHATTKLPIVYKRHEPFVYFMSICRDYCQERGITPDWKLAAKAESSLSTASEDCIDMQTLEKIVADEVESSKTQFQKREVTQQSSTQYVPPVHGPRSIWKQTDVRDEKFTVMGKVAFLDGDPAAQEWRQKSKHFDEFAAILNEGFSNQIKEL